MDQPTLSPQSNRLIEMCQAVMSNEKSPQELEDLLNDMYDGLEKAKGDFLEQVQKQNPDYITQVQPEMDLVLKTFDEYQSALDHIGGYLSDNNTSRLQSGIDMLIESTKNILDALTIYEGKTLMIGPTSFPILNMLILLSDNFKQGNVPDDQFRFMIYNATQFFQKILDEVQGYEGDEAVNSVGLLRQGYGKFIEGLGKLDEGAKAHNDLMIDDALQIIKDSQELIKSGYNKFNDEMFLEGPTESPYANIIIATINGVKKNVFGKDLLATNLEKYKEEMDTLRISVEGVMSVAPETSPAQEEFERTQQAFDLSDKAIEEIRNYLSNDNFAHLDRAVEYLKESTVLLKQSKESYDKIAETEGKIACIRCGTLNEPGQNMCSKCNALLPKKFEEGGTASTFQLGESGDIASGSGEEFVMTENVKKIFDKSLLIKEGRITFDEYLKTLKWMEDIICTSQRQIEANPFSFALDQFPEDQRAAAQEQIGLLQDTVEILKEGMEEFLEGLQELKLFGDDGDENHLRSGLETISYASVKLYQVQKVSDMSVKNLESSPKPAPQGTSAKPSAPAPEEETASDQDGTGFSDSYDGFTSSQEDEEQ